MADLAQIERALRAADAAGNTEDARRLAQAYAEAKGGQNNVVPPAAAPTQSRPANPVIDAARAIPGGLAQGVASIAGLPKDINDLIYSGAGWIADKVSPGSGDKVREFGKNTPAGQMPSPQTINNAVSEPFGGYYQPKTTAGEYAQTIASFAPAAIAPGSIPARIARAVVPGAASEAAGQSTKGTPYEPYARAAGALFGGVALGGIEGALNSRRNAAPTLDQIKQLKTANYKAAEQAGVVINPTSFQKFAADLETDLTTKNVVQSKLHENAIGALDAIKAEAKLGRPVSLERADAIRQVVNNAIEAGGKNNGGDARLAGKIKQSLDKYLDSLSAPDLVSGDASVAVPILKDARALAAREFKAKEIKKLIDLADNQASANYSAAGVETALRQQFKSFNAKLIKDPMLAATFTKAERDAIARVAKGGPVGNALRYLGKLAPTGVVSGGAGTSAGAIVGSLVGGPVGAGIGAVTVPTVGTVARAGATSATRRNALQALETTLRGSPIPANSAASVPQNALLSVLSQARP